MIGYVTLGSNDIPRGAAFYDELLGLFGAKRFMEMDSYVAWGSDPAKPMLSIIKPHDGAEATVGNGTMVALLMDNTDLVDTAHAKVLALGGVDEGPVGPRGEGGFYAGYCRDLDGNKLCFYHVRQS
ncbi:MAG: VOC family protein [Woeseiaceae bacterium]